MKEETTNIENIEENKKAKKKQKAAMAIRPSDYLETKFKEEVEKRGSTQTKLFEKMFWDYLHKASDEYKNKNLDCSLELQSIKAAASTLIGSIEAIVTKSQKELNNKSKEVDSMQEATERKIELATMELNNRITELEAKNKELESKLENSNAVITGFNTVKEDLEYKNTLLKDLLDSKDDEISSLKEQIQERDKAIKSLEKEMENSIKAISNIEKEVALIKEEKNNVEAKLVSVQANNQMLQDTLNNFNIMKITEIEAIRSNEATMSQLKLSSLEVSKNLEIDKLQATISSLEEKLTLKAQENSSLTETYNNIVAAKEKELMASFSKEKAILESTIAEKNNIIVALENAKKETATTKKKTKKSTEAAE